MKKPNEHIAKRWVLKSEELPASSESAIKSIGDTLAISPILASLLYSRGYRTPEEARRFIRMESELLCDPFLLADIDKAILRIQKALHENERIVIYGDYDVDGVTAVSTLYLYLKSKGAVIDYYIPNRAGEGYGVSVGAINKLAEKGVDLIITVDTGITAAEEVAYAKTLGIDTVVTDHHECRTALPEAVAVVNPHRPDCPYPFKELAGVGVVFKLICAFEERHTGDSRRECVARMCQEYADLVAIGTIADVMPIKEENRLIVSYGLGRMEKARRVGISALINAVTGQTEPSKSRYKSEPKITSGYIGYTLAPRLNAAGRIRSASVAVELFLTNDPERAKVIAEELCEANRERQVEENRITAAAFEKIEREHDFERDPVIVLDDDGWHHGVIGIVSSRVTERYGLPSILVSFEGNGEENSADDIGKGSGRSIKGMNLVGALQACSDTLLKYGGHELAAGLSVARGSLPAFRAKINEYARTHLSDEALIPTVEADLALSPSELDMGLASELRRYLEPYGTENPLPVFALFSVTVEEVVPVGGGKHTRLVLRDGEKHVTAMYFSHETAKLDLYPGEKVDLLFSLDINEWGGKRTVQLTVRDLRPAERERLESEAEEKRFEEIMGGDTFTAEERVVPNRDDFAAVYTVIRRLVRGGTDTFTTRSMHAQLSAAGYEIGLIKLKFIFNIFREMNILGIEEIAEDTYCFHLKFNTGKTDLERSNILKQLRLRERRH
ncbi:MAG: single-stranded-DNA-specific exonuclease RecJ [Ruminococcaceae bacterium]|nr:single-stranded-DNA-specific exonuclease RecJ [Oscillospiraceae bacterium]